MAKRYETGLIITGDASGGIRAIKATDDELGKLNQGFQRGSQRSKQFNADVNATGQGLAAFKRIAAPIAGLVAGMFAANTLQGQINWGDQLQKTNLRIGASTEALSQYNYVASLSGVEFNQLTTAWQRQTRRIAEAAQGTGVASAALESLNLNARELNQLAPEEQFERIAEAMQGVESSSERVRLAQKLWDSEGVKLVQIVNSGTDAIAQMRAEADALGLTISQETANAMATYNDEVDRLKFAAQGLTQTMLAELVPSLTQGLQTANGWVRELGGAEVIVGNVTDAATVLAALLAGRYAGAFATATAAKLGATRQAILYQAALARMAGVSATVAAGQIALAGSVRAASSAMALVGGPAGVAMLAVGALYYFREELGFVDAAAKNATQALDDNSAAIRDGSAAALDATYDNLIDSLEAVSLQAQEAMAQLTELEARQAFYENSHQGMADSVAGAIDQQAQALAGLWARQVELQTAIRRNREARENATRADRAATVQLEDLVVTTESSAAATREAAKATTTLSAAYEALLDRLQPNRRAARQYASDVNVLNLALVAGEMTAVQYMQAMGRLNQQFQEAQHEAEKTADAADSAGARIASSFTSWETVADNTLRRVDDSGQQLWLGLIDGSESALDTVKRGFQQTLAEIAHMLTTQQLTFRVAGMLGINTTGMPGAGLSYANVLGNAKNLWSSAGSLFGGATAAAPSLAMQGGLSSAALASASQVAGGATYGGWAGSAASGAALGNTVGGGFMSSVGAAMPWIGGALALDALTGGSIVGGISKALFGGSWKTRDAGVDLGLTGGSITGRQFENQHRKGGLFRSSKSRTNTSALDAEFADSLQLAYDAQEQALRWTLDTLGQQSSALNAYSTGLTRISTKDMSAEEVEAAVTEWLQGIVNNAARSVVDPSEYAMAGETTIETLNRLATALTGVNPLLEQLHNFAFEASLSGGAAASNLLELAGGIDALTQRTAYYYDNILTEAERHDAAMRQAAKAMSAFTLQTGRVINTTDELRTLVDGLDLTTEAGRSLYVAALDLAPALVEVENGLQRVRDRFADMLSEAESALSSAEQQARSAWQTFDRQSYQQQLQLLDLLGDSEAALALERARELATLDESLRPHQERIWALQDEAARVAAATTAARNYQTELARVRDQLSQSLGNIGQWVDQRTATSGAPGVNLAEAGDQFARQLVLAQAGDRNALQSITQYAEQYLTAGEAMYASGGAFQRIQQDVLDALKDLPDQISAEEFLAEEVKQALREQTQGISSNLGDVLRGDNPSSIAGNLAGYFAQLAGGIDGVLTREQLSIVMSGKATDAELRAIMRAVDLNGDGVMSGLESVIIAGMPTDAVLATALRNKMGELDKNQLTHAQVRAALSPIATDAEITNLIRQIDVNGDGIITAQELTNARVGGLTQGIVKGLNPAFSMLDANLDGKLTFGELQRGLKGIATDAELRAIMRAVDLNGDGVMSGLESVIIAGMPTDAVLATALRNKMGELDKNQLTHAQVRAALSPIASDAEINRLIKRLDANGDGIISKQELTAGRIGGLATGIAQSLSPSFSMLDENLDGLLTFGELQRGLKGMATDAELKAIMRAVDLNGDGVMSGLESVIIAGMPTDTVLATALRNKMNELDKNQLTHAQIRSALSPIASDAEISRLIKRLDANGDGIISKQELTAGRIGGLATGIAQSLSPSFGMLDENLDGLLTFAELQRGLKGMATDAELKSIMRALDLNGDGIVSSIEAQIAAGFTQGDVLKSALQSEMRRLGTQQLTTAQVKTALKGIATDAEIKALIKRVDTNGNGVVSAQELTNARLGGLAKGIGSTLAPMFDAIDIDGSGWIDYSEFAKAFAGMATDDELRRIFDKLDADGSGQISRLDALKRSSDGTEGNTKTLEERARDQLASINGLVSEMTRTTDQFVDLNSTMISLKDSINALGVAQQEIARIEREQAVRTIEEKAALATSRLDSAWSSQQAAKDEIAAIESRYKGIDVNRLRGTAGEGIRDGVDGWHYSNGKMRNWTGWESDFDRFMSTLRSAGLGDMTDKQYASWLKAEQKKQTAGSWSAHYLETLAGRVRAQAVVGRNDADSARKLDLYDQLPNLSGAIGTHEQQLDALRKEYRDLVGSAAPFANGGVFEFGRQAANSIVSSPTYFDMGLMGEAGPEALMPLSRGTGGRLSVDATGLMRIPDNLSIPQFPLLGGSDVLETLRDLKREVAELRRDNARLLGEGNRHAAASVAVQQEGFTQQIGEQKKGNRALDDMASAARLEKSR